YITRYSAHPPLHTFPTRRSSDLAPETATPAARAVPAEARLEYDAPIVIASANSPSRATSSTVASGAWDHKSESALQATKAKSARSEEHTSELQSPDHLVCRLLLE